MKYLTIRVPEGKLKYPDVRTAIAQIFLVPGAWERISKSFATEPAVYVAAPGETLIRLSQGS